MKQEQTQPLDEAVAQRIELLVKRSSFLRNKNKRTSRFLLEEAKHLAEHYDGGGEFSYFTKLPRT